MLDSSGSFKLFLRDKREIGRNLIPAGLQLPLPDPVTSVQQERVLSGAWRSFMVPGILHHRPATAAGGMLRRFMLRKRYYILFVARDEDGRVRKISLPVQYVYGFVAAALVGAFTIVGLAGSYTRMLLKTESFNQVRQERETLRKNYRQMAQIAHERDVQVASLGALASEVTAIYGLKQNKLAGGRHSAEAAAAAATPSTLALTDDVNQQDVKLSLDQFYALRSQALSGRV